MTLAAKQQQLIDDYGFIENSQERLSAIVDRARHLPVLPESARTEGNRVRGCISLAWVAGEVRDGRCTFRADADSPLVRGLLALMTDLYSGSTPSEIVALEPTLIEELGLSRQLSPTRLNGLRSVRAKIREFAEAQAMSQFSVEAIPPRISPPN